MARIVGVDLPTSKRIGIGLTYMRFGAGFEFFVTPEPLQTQVQIFARGNFSPAKFRDIMLDAEERIENIGHYSGIVTQSGAGKQMGGLRRKRSRKRTACCTVSSIDSCACVARISYARFPARHAISQHSSQIPYRFP